MINFRKKILFFKRSGLEQEDISSIYNYLKDLVIKNASSSQQTPLLAKFLVDDKIQKILNSVSETLPSTSSQTMSQDMNQEYFELKRIHFQKPIPEKYYLIPYNLSKLTFFIFIPARESFKLSLLKEIDEILARQMIVFLQEIADQQMKRNMI